MRHQELDRIDAAIAQYQSARAAVTDKTPTDTLPIEQWVSLNQAMGKLMQSSDTAQDCMLDDSRTDWHLMKYEMKYHP